MNNNNSYYDYIDTLPVNKNMRQSEVELELIRTLFNKQNKSLFEKLAKESYEPGLVGLLFLALSIPYSDNIIKSIFPVTTNLDIVFLVVKTLIIMVLYWLMKHTIF
jgi:hypothetical protein